MSKATAAENDELSSWEELAAQRDLFEELAADESAPMQEIAQDVLDELDRRGIDVSQ